LLGRVHGKTKRGDGDNIQRGGFRASTIWEKEGLCAPQERTKLSLSFDRERKPARNLVPQKRKKLEKKKRGRKW